MCVSLAAQDNGKNAQCFRASKVDLFGTEWESVDWVQLVSSLIYCKETIMSAKYLLKSLMLE